MAVEVRCKDALRRADEPVAHQRHDLGREAAAFLSVGQGHGEDGEPGAPDGDKPFGDGLAVASYPLAIRACRWPVRCELNDEAGQILLSRSVLLTIAAQHACLQERRHRRLRDRLAQRRRLLSMWQEERRQCPARSSAW